MVNRPMIDDDGIYQCFATNQFGTSISIQVFLFSYFFQFAYSLLYFNFFI